MRWQKTARIAIATAVVIFTAAVLVALLRRTPPPPASTASPRTDPAVTHMSPGRVRFERTSPDGKTIASIEADGMTTYADGRTKLDKATLTLPDRGGRTLETAADTMILTAPAGKAGELDTADMQGNVRMTTSDGLVVTTGAATYNQREGMLRAPGDVAFERGRMKGRGVGATYDEARQVLWLLQDARISIAADDKGQGAAEGTAASAGLARAEHYVRLTGGATIEGDGRTAKADDITLQLTDDDRRIRTMHLRGNSRIGGSGQALQEMAANDIDLTYAEDGRALQQSVLTENASVTLPAGEGAGERRVAARTMTIALAPDGATVTSLVANERVAVDLPAAGDAAARRITSAALTAAGPPGQGLRTATFTGSVEFREAAPAARGTPAAERVARADRLVVGTGPGFGALEEADFRGRVRFEEGATVGEAPRGLYHPGRGTLQLSPGRGDAGPPPRLHDDRMSVEAATLTLTLQSKQLTADTNVRSALQPKRGGKDPGKEGGRLPSMLESDKPVFVHGNRLEYDGTAVATYTGDARLFQDQTTVAGDTLVLDDRQGNLTARGHVRTVMYFDDEDPKTKEKKPAQTVGTAHELVYEEAKRLATYTSGESARAHINGPQGDVTADIIRLVLEPGGDALERAQAEGTVTVKEGQRVARGEHLDYTAADETYVMRGNPLEVDRFAPGECTRTMGVTLRFRRGDDTLVVDGIPGVTPFNTKPIPCR